LPWKPAAARAGKVERGTLSGYSARQGIAPMELSG